MRKNSRSNPCFNGISVEPKKVMKKAMTIAF